MSMQYLVARTLGWLITSFEATFSGRAGSAFTAGLALLFMLLCLEGGQAESRADKHTALKCLRNAGKACRAAVTWAHTGPQHLPKLNNAVQLTATGT